MTSLYKIAGNDLVPVPRDTIAAEDMLQSWIFKDPKILGLDVLPIGREVVTDFNGRIDILAIDRDGYLVIIELKRDRTPREIVAQILDYASWVTKLSTKQIHEMFLEKTERKLDKAFEDRFGVSAPENLNSDHGMVIVASEFDAPSKRIVEYLAEQHDININTAFFKVFKDGDQQLLATDWLMDQEQVSVRSESKKRGPWSGDWYANVGDGPDRAWDDMRKYGFLAAGGGHFYSGRLKQLGIGDPVFAYQKQAGYVGYGKVTSTAVMAKDFLVDGKPLLSLPLAKPDLAHDKDDLDLAEYVVGIEWHKTFMLSESKTFPGAFANQNVVCKLRDPVTIDFLKRTFEVA